MGWRSSALIGALTVAAGACASDEVSSHYAPLCALATMPARTPAELTALAAEIDPRVRRVSGRQSTDRDWTVLRHVQVLRLEVEAARNGSSSPAHTELRREAVAGSFGEDFAGAVGSVETAQSALRRACGAG